MGDYGEHGIVNWLHVSSYIALSWYWDQVLVMLRNEIKLEVIVSKIDYLSIKNQQTPVVFSLVCNTKYLRRMD